MVSARKLSDALMECQRVQVPSEGDPASQGQTIPSTSAKDNMYPTYLNLQMHVFCFLSFF